MRTALELAALLAQLPLLKAEEETAAQTTTRARNLVEALDAGAADDRLPAAVSTYRQAELTRRLTAHRLEQCHRRIGLLRQSGTGGDSTRKGASGGAGDGSRVVDYRTDNTDAVESSKQTRRDSYGCYEGKGGAKLQTGMKITVGALNFDVRRFPVFARQTLKGLEGTDETGNS
jgi:hypothetical protein